MSFKKLSLATICATTTVAAMATQPVIPPIQAPYPGTSLMMRCGEMGEPQGRSFSVFSTTQGVEARFQGRAAIAGSYLANAQSFQFVAGNRGDDDYVSLEIKRVNSRYVGVMLERAANGPGYYKESVFKCAEIMTGSASSNGR